MVALIEDGDEVEWEEGHNVIHSDNDDIDSVVNETEMENDPFVPGNEDGGSLDEEFVRDPEEEHFNTIEEQQMWDEDLEKDLQSESDIESDKTNQNYNLLYRTKVSSPALSSKSACYIVAMYSIF